MGEISKVTTLVPAKYFSGKNICKILFFAGCGIITLSLGSHLIADERDEQEKMISKILALPYLQGSRSVPAKVRVTYHDPKLAYEGLNLYTSGPQAILIDMDGNVIHKWGSKYNDGGPMTKRTIKGWHWAWLYDNGDLLTVGDGLRKLDKDSNLLWFYDGECHHDLCVGADGNIYVLESRKISRHPELNLKCSILDDCITILSPIGKKLKSISILECFLNSDYASILSNMRPCGDVFHTNTIELLDGSLADRFPMFKKDHVLVSIRHLSTIAVIDLARAKVTWALSGMWKMQHNPTILENGNILLLDNLGHHGRSKVIEFNPLTQKIVWAYRGDSENGFFTEGGGSNQRLPNGNTLITEAENGRAFEVTPDNKIVWEFLNPFRAGPEGEFIASFQKMIRIKPDRLTFLKKPHN